ESGQLTYFLAALQTQNFRKAAELCLVARPALSRQIAALEKELFYFPSTGKPAPCHAG
ncbi:MAG: LysR family transcriptional regulator, partial [Ktedonobacteraceae bacterium]